MAAGEEVIDRPFEGVLARLVLVYGHCYILLSLSLSDVAVPSRHIPRTYKFSSANASLLHIYISRASLFTLPLSTPPKQSMLQWRILAREHVEGWPLTNEGRIEATEHRAS